MSPKKQENLREAAEKGIPESQLGTSGKPKMISVVKPNNEKAKDAAVRNEVQPS